MAFRTGHIAGLDYAPPPRPACRCHRASRRKRHEPDHHPRHVTKLQFAYAALRDAIIRCELKPGERLVIDDLARRFDVSIIPVREALRMLESEGLRRQRRPHRHERRAGVASTGVEVFAMLEGLETVSARGGRAHRRPKQVCRGSSRSSAAWTARSRPIVLASGPSSTPSSILPISALSGMPMVEQMLRPRAGPLGSRAPLLLHRRVHAPRRRRAARAPAHARAAALRRRRRHRADDARAQSRRAAGLPRVSRRATEETPRKHGRRATEDTEEHGRHPQKRTRKKHSSTHSLDG